MKHNVANIGIEVDRDVVKIFETCKKLPNVTIWDAREYIIIDSL